MWTKSSIAASSVMRCPESQLRGVLIRHIIYSLILYIRQCSVFRLTQASKYNNKTRLNLRCSPIRLTDIILYRIDIFHWTFSSKKKKKKLKNHTMEEARPAVQGHFAGIGEHETNGLRSPEGQSGVAYQAPSTRRTARGEVSDTDALSGAPRGIGENGDGGGLSSAGTHHYGADSLSYITSGTYGRSDIPRDTFGTFESGSRDVTSSNGQRRNGPDASDVRVPRNGADAGNLSDSMIGTGEITPGAGHTSMSASHSTAGTTHHKPTLKEKLNPKKDADGDGKAGIMD